ncbi:DUF4468 domain-containing protein [Pontibacter sp. HJ8]
MKRLILLLLALLPLFSFAQSTPPRDESGKIVYSEVVPVEGLSQQELYSRARAWFATTFNSANDVIQMDSKEEGTIIGNGITDLDIGNSKQKVHFTLSLQFKDGRYKYEITNIAYQGNYNPSIPGADRKVSAEEFYSSPNVYKKNGEMRPTYKVYYDAGNTSTTRLINSFKSALSATVSKGDGW